MGIGIGEEVGYRLLPPVDRVRALLPVAALHGRNIDQLAGDRFGNAKPPRGCPFRGVGKHREGVDHHRTDQCEARVVLVTHLALTSSGLRASSATSSVRPARASARSRPPTSTTLRPASPPRTRIQTRRGRTNSDKHKPVTANPSAIREMATPGVAPICSLTQRTQPSNWIEPLPSGRLTPSPILRPMRTGAPSASLICLRPVVSSE